MRQNCREIRTIFRTFFIAASESDDVHVDVKDTEEAAEDIHDDEVPRAALKTGAKYVEKTRHIVQKLMKAHHARGLLWVSE